MLKITHLKEGDIITVDDDGIMREGTVVRVSREEHQALVDNGVQEFWYSQEDMYSLPLDGAVKYKKDSFRLVTPQKGDFTNLEMWWREDRRHFDFPITVHELQNLYLDMTKVHLDKASNAV